MKKGPSLLVRLTVYPVIATIFVAVALFMTLLSFGYSISYEDGKIVTTKTGIIIIASSPGDAEVYLNGELHRKRTPALPFINLKLNRLPAGDYNIKISKEDYVTWKGKVTVNPGFVSWLDYVYLIPLEKEDQPFNFPANVNKMISSQDKELLLASVIDEDLAIQTVWSVNTATKSRNKMLEIDLEKRNKIDPVSVSYSNERFLYKEKIDEVINLKVQEISASGQSWNITNQFGFDFDSITFSPYSHNELYGLRDGNLYKINYTQRSMTASLVSNIIGIYPNENEMLLVKTTEDNYGLWKIERNNDIKNIIKALPASKNYRVSFMEDAGYYLVYINDEKDLVLYTNNSKNPTLETISKNTLFFRASPNEKRVAIKTDKNLKVYDLESEEYYTIADQEGITMVDWFSDSSNLIFISDDELRMVNYNGYYNQPLFTINKKFSFIVSATNNHIYYTNIIEEINDLFVFSF